MTAAGVEQRYEEYSDFPSVKAPYLIVPYLTLPRLTLPYLTLPYLILPYLTLPYLTLPGAAGPEQRYEEYSDFPSVKAFCEGRLEEYNYEPGMVPMQVRASRIGMRKCGSDI